VRIIVAVVALSLAVAYQSPSNVGSASFVGRMVAGQSFARELGNKLFFCLTPESARSGDTVAWAVLIGPRCALPADNFASVVTPPLHGPNALDIAAWHFDPDVNAPQYLRSFRFVLTKADYDLMFGLLRDRAAGNVLAAMDARGKGEGMVSILDLKRHKTATGEAAFDWIEFEADLWWPKQ
jgi:hypothetical protein